MHPLIFLHRFKKNLKTNGLNRWLSRGLKPLLYHTRGFTLIEVIVSLAIMSVSIVAILQLFSGGLRSIKISDDYLRAAILAQNKMNELGSKFSIFINQEGVFEQDDRYHWSLSVENYDLAGLHPQFENLKDENIEKPVFVDKVRLKVFWKTAHGQREMELVTLKTAAMVTPSPKDIVMGRFSQALIASRGVQFGGQNLPGGQSEDVYGQFNISGTEMTVKMHICGAEIKAKISGN